MIIAATKCLAQGGVCSARFAFEAVGQKKFFDLGLGVPPESQVTRFVRVNAHQDALNAKVIIVY